MSMQAATLEILEKDDLPPRQARAIAQAIELELAPSHGALATRHDLRDLRNELKVDMAEHKSKLVRWVFLCILGQTAMLLGAGYFFLAQYTA